MSKKFTSVFPGNLPIKLISESEVRLKGLKYDISVAPQTFFKVVKIERKKTTIRHRFFQSARGAVKMNLTRLLCN